MKNDAKKCLSSKHIVVRKTALATILVPLMSFPASVLAAEIPISEFNLSDFYFPVSGETDISKGLIGEDTSLDGLIDLNKDVFNAIYFVKGGGKAEIYQGIGSATNDGDKIDAHLIFKGALDLEYSVKEPSGNCSTAFNFFEPSALNGSYTGLHEFEFNDNISVAIKHADINVSYMGGQGVDNPGLLVTNKKRIVTFNEKANLRIGYQVDFQNNSDSKLFILAGIYTTFGAANVMWVPKIFELPNKDELEKLPTLSPDQAKKMQENSKASRMGVTTFEKGLNLTMVNSQSLTDASAPMNRAAYGIFVNEGGTVNIRGGQSNIVLIGSEGSTAISAVNVSARAGILDVMKQGKFNLMASEGMSRLWSFSSDIIDNAPLSPMPDQTAEDADKHRLMMRDAVQTFHGAHVVIEDVAEKGSLDIRGDILAGIKNESYSFFSRGDVSNSHVGNFKGAVNNASAAIRNCAEITFNL